MFAGFAMPLREIHRRLARVAREHMTTGDYALGAPSAGRKSEVQRGHCGDDGRFGP